MFTMPDAIALLAVTLPIAAAIWKYAPQRANPNAGNPNAVDASEASNGAQPVNTTGLENRVRQIEIEQRGFREEVRGEFKALKTMIQFLPSGQRRQGGIGFGDGSVSP
jgi:hypothetical protein